MYRQDVFLYRLKNSDDRDCCAYIDNQPQRFECGHYFGEPILHGNCYSGCPFDDYDDIDTILTSDEYQLLCDFGKSIAKLGFGITPGDERYQKGVVLCEAIQPVYDKLNGAENKAFYERIVAEEKVVVAVEYGIGSDDVDDIFDNYNSDRKDRSLVQAVYDDAYDLGKEQMLNWGYGGLMSGLKDIFERFFDYEAFGEYLLEDDIYYELPDGRIVEYSV
jgi:hypothetical protein